LSEGELTSVIDNPIRKDHATVIDGRVFFSWLRPKCSFNQKRPFALDRMVIGEPLLIDDWEDCDAPLWIVEFASVDIHVDDAVQMVFSYLLSRKLAVEGELVLFHRQNGARIGYMPIRPRGVNR
jgi:hypothetical protein